MKTINRIFLVGAFLLGFTFISILRGDPPSGPPPMPGGGHGGGNQGPSGAPIDGGIGILVVLGTAFAGIKVLKSKNHPGGRG